MKEVKIQFKADGEEGCECFTFDSKGIDLSGLGITSIDLSTLREFNSPEHLLPQGNLLQGIGLSPANDCASLRRVDLSDNQLCSVDLDSFGPCSELDTLLLSGNKLGTIHLSSLSECSGLIHFDLSLGQLQTIDLSPLGKCNDLECIDTSVNQLRTAVPSGFDGRSNLRCLCLDGNGLDSGDLGPLNNRVNLEGLSLTDNLLQNMHIPDMSQYSQFKYLDLSGNQLQEMDLSGLKMNSGFQDLFINDDNFQDIDLTPLKGTSNPQVIGFGDNPMGDIDPSTFGEFTGSQFLWANGLGLAHVDFSPLGQCQDLQSVWPHDNRLSHIDLSQLQGASHLERIDLSQNAIETTNVSSVLQHISFRELVLDPNMTLTFDSQSEDWRAAVHSQIELHVSTSEYLPDPISIFSRYQTDNERTKLERFFDGYVQVSSSMASELLKKVEEAKTNDEKKNSLEELVEYLFACVVGFEVLPSKRTKTGEIDRIVRNNRSDHPLFRWIGMDFLLEAKNWKTKVGAPEVIVFARKVNIAGCKLGVLIAKSGVTGRKDRDARGVMSEEFTRSGVVVTVLDYKDLKQVAEGGNLLELLRTRIEERRFS